MTEVRVGLCGFTMAIGQYPSRFPVVEVQQTFYEPPAITTLERWRAAVPETFEFTVKAWQLITHQASSPTYRRTKRTLSAAEREGCGFFADTPITREAHARTIACARVLRATAVLFQCPASFAPTDENVDRMRRYFRRRTNVPPRLAGGDRLRYLWEPRGPRWVAARERAVALADELGLVLVVDPFVTRPEPGRPVYFRLHGIGGSAHSYSEAELAELGSMTGVTPGGEPAYVLFNNLPRVGDATRFARSRATARQPTTTR